MEETESEIDIIIQNQNIQMQQQYTKLQHDWNHYKTNCKTYPPHRRHHFKLLSPTTTNFISPHHLITSSSHSPSTSTWKIRTNDLALEEEIRIRLKRRRNAAAIDDSTAGNFFIGPRRLSYDDDDDDDDGAQLQLHDNHYYYHQHSIWNNNNNNRTVIDHHHQQSGDFDQFPIIALSDNDLDEERNSNKEAPVCLHCLSYSSASSSSSSSSSGNKNKIMDEMGVNEEEDRNCIQRINGRKMRKRHYLCIFGWLVSIAIVAILGFGSFREEDTRIRLVPT